MHQAGRKIPGSYRSLVIFLAALVAGWVTLKQPQAVFAAPASASSLQNNPSASKLTLNTLESVLAKAPIVSFKEKSVFLSGVQSVEYTLRLRDNTAYASAKVEEQASEAKTAPAGNAIQYQVQQAEVTGEAIVAEVHDLNAEVLLGLVNQHRTNIGLQVLQKDDRLMQVASERTPELFDEIFVNGNMHAGFYGRNLSYQATENIIYYNTEEGAFQWWLNSSIHRAAIENPGHTHTGIACSGRFCSMIYSSFQPK